MNTYISKILEASHNNKYTKWYIDIINKALTRVAHKSNKAEYKRMAKARLEHPEGHHIWPKSLGLAEDRRNIDNIAYLTCREHFMAHLLLPKMMIETRHRHLMILAKRSFITTRPRGTNSRMFEVSRSEHASIMSLLKTGTKIDPVKAKKKALGQVGKYKSGKGLYINNVFYKSIAEAARHIGVCETSVTNRLASSRFPNYSLSPTENVYCESPRPRKTPIVVGNDIFDSMLSAAKHYNICVGSVRDRVLSKNFPEWNYLNVRNSYQKHSNLGHINGPDECN